LATEVAEAVNLLSHLRAIGDAARQAGMHVFFVLHHRWELGDDVQWKHANHIQIAAGQRQPCAKDTWGGTLHADCQPHEGDIMSKEPRAQSGCTNPDLDPQLKQHGLETMIIMGRLAHTCIESTGRFGMELGYHVTLVKDATAAFS
jgi:nicotinamidase-related amidase